MKAPGKGTLTAALLAATPWLLAGCASLPADRGHGDVAAMLKARGQTLPAPTDAAGTQALVKEITGKPLTVAEAVRLALVNNPAMQAQYAALGFAAAEVYDAGRLSNPSLSASVMTSDAAGAGTKLGFGLAQSFTNLLMLGSRSRFAEGEFERVQQLVGAQVLDLAADTETAYYEYAGAMQVEAMREAVVTAAGAAATLAHRFFDAGNINRLELAHEQAAAAQAQLDAMQAGLASKQARSQLNQAMGLAAGQVPWTIAGGLPAPLEKEDDPKDLLTLADSSRLDLAAARRHVSLMADALGVTRRFRLLGEVDLGVELEREGDGSRLLGPALSLELPVFNQGQGRVARAKAGLQQAEAELRTLEIAISNAVRQQAEAVAAEKARAELFRGSLIPLRETIVARTQEEVNYMLQGQFELLAVKQQEYDAYQGYLEAVRDYWLARVELTRQVGAALPSSAHAGKGILHAQEMIKPRGGGMDHDMQDMEDEDPHAHHHGDHE